MLAAFAADPEPWLLTLSAMVFAATFVPWSAQFREQCRALSRSATSRVRAKAAAVALVSRQV